MVWWGDMVPWRQVAAVAAAVVLAGCTQHHAFKPYAGYKMAPYTVRGWDFVPMGIEAALRYEQDGIASHYEAGGARGALGQRLYRDQLYAAHRTLPLPCVVRITNLSNGRSTLARVADRGPFIPGRLIDVSTAVAERLGFVGKGLENVRVQVLSVGDGPYRRTAADLPQPADTAPAGIER